MEFELLQQQVQEIETEWDKILPIIKDGNTYDCYLNTDIQTPDTYNELCYLIDHAAPYETFNIHLNTPGGYMISAWKIIQSIRNTKAKIVGILTGEVASAGTIITMYCHDIVVDPFICFMVHNYSGGASGKAHEMEAALKFAKENQPVFFREVYNNFLTKAELSRIIKGEDLYLNATEVISRWEKRNDLKSS